MHTELAAELSQDWQAEKAQDILRACVHCGFCTAACPTYRLTGDELDSPRGRIYLIKQMLEKGAVSELTQMHLDRCLTCGACEPACPSGVRYRNLLEIGRSMVETRVPRSWPDRLVRLFMIRVVSDTKRFAAAVRLGRGVSWMLPGSISKKLPLATRKIEWPRTNHPRRMLALQGCVQPTAAPQTNAAAARVLDRLGIMLAEIKEAGCCGAISHHLAASDQARQQARRNIDAWWPEIEAGAEAIVMTASGCGLMVKEYAGLLQDDPAYAGKAARVSEITKDLVEVLAVEDLNTFAGMGQGMRIAFQCPCTMQHGQGLDGMVEGVLRRCGYVMTHVPDSQQCCGSAGTYSVLQPKMAGQLLELKLAAVTSDRPLLIVSANIGCQMHLAAHAELPVKHWIELLDENI